MVKNILIHFLKDEELVRACVPEEEDEVGGAYSTNGGEEERV
jgi:hypothetical protein